MFVFEGYFLKVPDRRKETLETLIKKHIIPGTHNMSDGWAAYKDLGNIEGGIYTHSKIIHENRFVLYDDEGLSFIHTQNIENLWMRLKKKFRRQSGTSINLFESYLDEYLWMEKHK